MSNKFRMLDLFSGIGGFSLSASWVWGDDLDIVCFCEKDEFCRKVLNKHWPNVPCVEDVNDVDRIAAYAKRCESKRIGRPGNLEGQEREVEGEGDQRQRMWNTVGGRCEDVAAYSESNGWRRGLPQSNVEQHRHQPSQHCGGQGETTVDLMCGGPPCQPASTAGLRKGSTDPRWLWPQTIKIVEAVKPRWIMFENPIGIVSLAEPICKPQVESKTLRRGKTEDRYEAILTQQEALLLSSIIKDLKDLGYQFPEACDGTPILPVIPASSVGAPHRRDRVWIVANSDGRIRDGRKCQQERETERRAVACGADCHASDPNIPRSQVREMQPGNIGTQCATLERNTWHEHWYEVAQRFCGVSNGLSCGLAGCLTYPETHSIMGYILNLRRIHYAKTNEARSEALSILREATRKASVPEFFGRFREIYAPEILRCSVHGTSNDQRESKLGGITEEGNEISREDLREVWNGNRSSYSPSGQEPKKQCSCQFDDIVWELSSEMALGEWSKSTEAGEKILFDLWKESSGLRFLHEPLSALQEVWRSVTDKEIGSFRRHYYQRDRDRVSKLRALGNAIVPQVAAQIMRAIKATDERKETEC